MTGDDTMAAEGHDGPDSESESHGEVPQSSDPEVPSHIGWAADKVPVIFLALLVLGLMIAGAVSDDCVSSCVSYP